MQVNEHNVKETKIIHPKINDCWSVLKDIYKLIKTELTKRFRCHKSIISFVWPGCSSSMNEALVEEKYGITYSVTFDRVFSPF